MILKHDLAKTKLNDIENVIKEMQKNTQLSSLLENNQISADIYKIEYTDEDAKEKALSDRTKFGNSCTVKRKSFILTYNPETGSSSTQEQNEAFEKIKDLYLLKKEKITNEEIESILMHIDDVESQRNSIFDDLESYIETEKLYFDAKVKVEASSGYLMGLYKNNGEETTIIVKDSDLTKMRSQYEDGHNDGGGSHYEAKVNKNLVGMGFISQTVYQATKGVMGTVLTTLTSSVLSNKVKLPESLISASSSLIRMKDYAISGGINKLGAIKLQAEIFDAEMKKFLDANHLTKDNINIDGLTNGEKETIEILVGLGEAASICGVVGMSTAIASFGFGFVAGLISDIQSEKNGVAAYEYFCRTGKKDGTTYIPIKEPNKKIEYDMNDYGFHIIKADGTENDITGTSGRDHIEGIVDSNDTLRGGGEADTIIGGLGADILYGGSGNDTYIYNKGDGNDTIIEKLKDNPSSWHDNGKDTLVLNGINEDDVDIYRQERNLIIDIKNDEGSITVEKYFSINHTVLESTLDYIQFEDKGKISISDLNIYHGTNLDSEYTVNDDVNYTLYGNGGDDTLTGKGGNDTLYGDDYQNNLTGIDHLYGGTGDDHLYGGKGNDHLYGGEEDDTYIFRAGDGQDTINEDSGSNDKIIFENVSSSQIRLEYSEDKADLIIKIHNTSDQVTIKNYKNDSNRIENIKFSDTESSILLDDFINNYATEPPEIAIEDLTLNYKPYIGRTSLPEISGNERYHLNMSDASSEFKFIRELNHLIIYKNSENQITVNNFFLKDNHLLGTIRFNDSESLKLSREDVCSMFADTGEHPIRVEWNGNYSGTSKGETIEGDSESNTFFGGQGDDTLVGKAGSDTYIIKKDHGNTVIEDNDSGRNDTDKLLMQDRNRDEVDFSVSDDGNHLIISSKNTVGITETITIENYYLKTNDKYNHQIEKIYFKDTHGSIEDFFKPSSDNGGETPVDPPITLPKETLENLVFMSDDEYVEEITARHSDNKCVYWLSDVTSKLISYDLKWLMESNQAQFIRDGKEYLVDLETGAVKIDGVKLDKTYDITPHVDNGHTVVSKDFVENIFHMKTIGEDSEDKNYLIKETDSASDYNELIGKSIADIKEVLLSPTDDGVDYDGNTVVISERHKKPISFNSYEKEGHKVYSLTDFISGFGIKQYRDSGSKVTFVYDYDGENKSVILDLNSKTTVVNSYVHNAGTYAADPFRENGHVFVSTEFLEGLLDLKVGRSTNEVTYLIDEDKKASLYNDCYGKSLDYIFKKLFYTPNESNETSSGGSSSQPTGSQYAFLYKDYGNEDWINFTKEGRNYTGTDKAERIDANNRNNVLEGKGGDDKILAYDGNDRLYGGDGDDFLTGFEDDDKYWGGNGNDVYEILDNHGIETIYDYAEDHANTTDTVFFSYSDQNKIELSISEKNKDDLKIKFSNERDYTIIKNFMVSSAYRPERFIFEDYTIWSTGKLMGEFLKQNPFYSSEEFRESSIIVGEETASGSVTLTGDSDDNVLMASNSNTRISAGRGDDYLYGGLGDDKLNGDKGDDVLNGGAGDDYLYGGYGNDKYEFNRGFGVDTIQTFYEKKAGRSIMRSASDGECLIFNDILSTEIKFSISNDRKSLVIEVEDSEDSIVVDQYFTLNVSRITSMKFSDGVEWDEKNIMQRVEESLKIYGTESNEEIFGVLGSKFKTVIHGMKGDDKIYGSYAEDELYGGEDDDTLYGDQGNDSLYGEQGDDIIHGQEGDDFIIGGLGNDYLYGGYGDDKYKFSRGSGIDRIQSYYMESIDGYKNYGKASGEHIFFDGICPNEIKFAISKNREDLDIKIANSNDKVIIDKYLSLNISNITKISFGDGTVWNEKRIKEEIEKSFNLYGTESNDNLEGPKGEKFAVTLHGLSGDDLLNGSDLADKLYGDEGDDEIYGYAGNDFISGGIGNDKIRGSLGNDQIEGNEGNDNLCGGSGNDFVRGGLGKDILNGDIGNDCLYGGLDDDKLNGDKGDDVLNGGAGDDYLYGGYGNDKYEFNRGFGVDTIQTFYEKKTGRSIMRSASDGECLIFNDILSTEIKFSISNDRKSLVIEVEDSEDSIVVDQYFTLNVSRITSMKFSDGVEWDEKNIMQRVEESLKIYGTESNEEIFGVLGSKFKTVIHGMKGDDKIYGSYAEDELYGGEDDDTLYGDQGNDSLYGEQGDDIIHGQEGDDFIIGGLGNDYLYGGYGDDKYKFSRGSGIDRIQSYYMESIDGYKNYGKASGEHIFFDGICPNEIKFAISKNREDLDIKIANSNDKVIIDKYLSLNISNITKISFGDGTVWNEKRIKEEIEKSFNLYGTESNDNLEGPKGEKFAVTLHGLSGDDLLNGSDLADKLYGDEGDDEIYGYAGNDFISGGIGNDKIRGSLGNDQIEGNEGNDNLCGGSGNDFVRGGLGKDILNGDIGNDCLYGGLDDDKLNGDKGDDVLNGGAGDDYLYGGYGNDKYEFNRGFGVDTIQTFYEKKAGRSIMRSASDGECLIFNDILSTEIKFSISNDRKSLVIEVEDSEDSIVVDQYFTLNVSRITSMKFSDGVEWDEKNIMQRVEESLKIYGTESNEEIFGVLGSKFKTVIHGMKGDDKIYGSYAEDELYGGEDDDTLYGDQGNDSLYGEQGDDIIHGQEGDDFIIGGQGNDYLEGGYGNDIYIFSKEFGKDIINNSNSYGSDKVIVDKKYSQIQYKRENYDLIIEESESNTINISNYFKGSSNRVDQIVFENNFSINSDHINLLIQAMSEYCSTNGVTWTDELVKENTEVQEILSQYYTNI